MEDIAIIRGTEEAINEVLHKDWEIINNTVNERTICHKFAEYLQRSPLFSNYSVDVEYNRNREKGKDHPKYLLIINEEFEHKQDSLDHKDLNTFYQEVSTFPDIIIHKRLVNTHNLLVIEVKKNNNNSNWSIDYRKLKGFTLPPEEGYGYTLGVHVNFFVDKPVVEIQWYKKGEELNKKYQLLPT